MSEYVTLHLHMPNQERHFDHIRENAQYATRMIEAGSRVGKTVAICGAGPSLRDYEPSFAHEVWACNSALPYLMSRGHRVTHGFCIDQGREMLDEWRETFDVEYLLASTVHPDLTRHILAERRSVTFFHNVVSAPDDQPAEVALYRTLYPTSGMAGHGLNSVARAVCLAAGMGFAHIRVYGADCSAAPDPPEMPACGTPEYIDWMKQVLMYADGRTAFDAFGGSEPLLRSSDTFDPHHRWYTRPDMVVSASHLVELTEAFPGRIEFIGHHLLSVVAARVNDAPFMAAMPRLTANEDGKGAVIGVQHHEPQPA